MSLLLNRQMERALREQVPRQNAIISKQPGLTIYAVPWDYALCGKIDRLTKPEQRPYDAGNAVAYLHECVKASSGHAIQAHQIMTFYLVIFTWTSLRRSIVTHWKMLSHSSFSSKQNLYFFIKYNIHSLMSLYNLFLV